MPSKPTEPMNKEQVTNVLNKLWNGRSDEDQIAALGVAMTLINEASEERVAELAKVEFEAAQSEEEDG